MKIEIKLYASLACYMPVQEEGSDLIRAEVKAGTTVKQLLDKLKVPADHIKIIFLNGTHAGGDAVLKDGDRLGVFPPVAGG